MGFDIRSHVIENIRRRFRLRRISQRGVDFQRQVELALAATARRQMTSNRLSSLKVKFACEVFVQNGLNLLAFHGRYRSIGSHQFISLKEVVSLTSGKLKPNPVAQDSILVPGQFAIELLKTRIEYWATFLFLLCQLAADNG
jgi:hypothetical protein